MAQNPIKVGPFAVNPSGTAVPLKADADGGLIISQDDYTYKACPTSATTALGAAGAVGDFLLGILVTPLTAAAAAISIKDGSTTIEVFAGGGTTALVDLKPFFVPLGLTSVNGGWSVVVGANAQAIAVGEFA